MPQNAIIRANGTGDYTSIIAWEAGEQSSDYGAVTVGRVDGFFDEGSSQTIIQGTWTNGARLEPFDSADAFDGTERSLCGLTSTAGITLRNTGKKVEFAGLEVYNTGTGRAYSNTTNGGDLSASLCLFMSDTGDTVNNNTTVGLGIVGCVISSTNGNPHRDGTFDQCTFFGNTTAALGAGGTNTTDNSATVNADTGACYRGSVTQSNNASSDATADTLDNIIIANEFVSATPVASGDYRILSTGDLASNVIGAFIQSGGGGISGTITQTTNSFTQSLVGTIVNPTTTGTITQTAQSFTQAAIGETLLNITGTITQSASAFTQSLSGNVTENITGVISQSLSSFTQSLLGAIAIPVTGNINQTASSFTQSAIGVVPIQWTDKLPASTTWTNQAETITNWTNQSGVSTIWTDKV